MDSSEKSSIRRVLLRATHELIATYDNDGTLGREQQYVQALVIFDRIRTLAPQHPEWKTHKPFASALKSDLKAAFAGDQQALLRWAWTHAGMSTEEFNPIGSEWIATAKNLKNHRLYTRKDWKVIYPFDAEHKQPPTPN